ncbi:2,5-didehydrogluconate reductase [Paraburkholderia ginsengiterrae]|uniref:2,5-didehydrogluconate reductase n=1 Tax=Paraburkholderia ginsengiterrae TaxID=1462993 RepID=A0A1A9N3J2_9BURK|nr:aldo/keto reductase [Paraburkholderia ginsengiterrae]OAJ57282.1 2,5-didehydrogluconate reductase [Paraburkholderia ginsengiterrae]OAJ60938.1 2,5-didehydrogluconate reductase [Paraburkholderia ginsengiterrae]
MQNVVQAHGAAIPTIGYGTYGMNSQEVHRVLPAALRAGFRHIDTAQVYGNEAEVGDCVAASGIPRAEVFITTKVWVSNYHPRHFGASVDESLHKLKTDYIDLLLLHWPGSDIPLPEQIGALNASVKAGKVRHIGVSNYNRELMDDAIRLSDIPIVTNQFEYHPYLNQSLLIESTREAGLAVTGYCGMAVGNVLSDPVLKEMAARYGKTIAQIVLRWLVQQDGVVALSRTSKIERLPENLAVFDFELQDEDMAAIHARARPNSRIVNPPGLSPQWDSTEP